MPKKKAKWYIDTEMRIALDAAKQAENGWEKEDIQNREDELLNWAKGEWAD